MGTRYSPDLGANRSVAGRPDSLGIMGSPGLGANCVAIEAIGFDDERPDSVGIGVGSAGRLIRLESRTVPSLQFEIVFSQFQI